MTSFKKAVKLRKESDARAKAEERLQRATKVKASTEQKVQVQVEQKLHTQQLRFGALIEKIQAQINEESAKARAQLEELLERVSSYKAEAERKRAELNDAREQLRAETAAKIRAYEKLRIEKRQRRKTQAMLTGDTTQVKTQAIVRPIRVKSHTKRNAALLSIFVIFSTAAIVLILVTNPFAIESGQEEIQEPASVIASVVSDITTERLRDDTNTAGLVNNTVSSTAVNTASTVAPKFDSKDEAELKVNEEQSITETDNEPTIIEERPVPKIITSVNSHIVQSSDNNRWEMQIGTYVSYAFTEVFIPADTVITSVVIFIEHFEEDRFIEGRLEWSIGTGWPDEPEIWASIKAPIHRGESNENIDMWDVTGVVDTVEKLKALQLHVKNNSYSYKSKTLMDYAYMVVEYD